MYFAPVIVLLCLLMCVLSDSLHHRLSWKSTSSSTAKKSKMSKPSLTRKRKSFKRKTMTLLLQGVNDFVTLCMYICMYSERAKVLRDRVNMNEQEARIGSLLNTLV